MSIKDMSGNTVMSKTLTHNWLFKLHKYGISGSSLVIEITEVILIKDDPMIQ
jgi:EAL domain-containing protein (putative c-di-GMP-specific phosphodiesterase class I)